MQNVERCSLRLNFGRTKTEESVMATQLRFLITVWVGLTLLQTLASGTTHEFYNGKAVRIVVGYAPGAGYDFYARVLARHVGKHIPGNPTAIVENMPWA